MAGYNPVYKLTEPDCGVVTEVVSRWSSGPDKGFANCLKTRGGLVYARRTKNAPWRFCQEDGICDLPTDATYTLTNTLTN